MKAVFNFLKTTVIGGFLFLLPLALTVMLLGKALAFVAKLARPIANLLPFQTVAGLGTAYVIAVLFLIVIGFAAGLIAKTGIAEGLRKRVENLILRFVPGYTLLTNLAKEDANLGSQSGLSVALIGGGDKWEIGFVIEKNENGYVTIFKPGAPTPTSGSVCFLPESQVKRLDVPVSEAVRCLMKTGGGSKELLKGRL